MCGNIYISTFFCCGKFLQSLTNSVNGNCAVCHFSRSEGVGERGWRKPSWIEWGKRRDALGELG